MKSLTKEQHERINRTYADMTSGIPESWWYHRFVIRGQLEIAEMTLEQFGTPAYNILMATIGFYASTVQKRNNAA